MTHPKRVDYVEAMRHLDPVGALAGLDLDDYEGVAIRAAWRDYLAGLGMWPASNVRQAG